MTNAFDKIYKNPQYLKPWECEFPEFPFVVDVELTNHCNLSCRMCPHSLMKREKGYMGDTVLKKIVDECAERGAAIRFIRWGEHLLHQNIFEYISYAKSKGVLVHLTTNGILLDSSKAEKLIDSGLDSVIFSMQGATKEGYEIMRNNNKYDLLEKNIETLVEIRKRKGIKNPFIHISSTMTDETLQEIKAFKDKWLNIVDSVGVGVTTFEYVNTPENRENIKEFTSQQYVRKEYRPCTEVLTKLSVNWNGDVTACCGDYDGFLLLGNVKEESLKDIWVCDKLKKIRQILERLEMDKLPLCKDCYATYEELRPEK